MVAGRGEEDLRLVFQAPERLTVNDPVPIVLIRGTDIVFLLGLQAATRVGALGGLRRQHLALALLEPFTDGGQRCPPGSWFRGRAARRRSSPPAFARDPRTSVASLYQPPVVRGVRL